MKKENKTTPFPLSYESDGEMNKKGKKKNVKEQEAALFFNTTQNSE